MNKLRDENESLKALEDVSQQVNSKVSPDFVIASSSVTNVTRNSPNKALENTTGKRNKKIEHSESATV